uniref:Putative ixostatin n=1 Tax=Ixodes ricinus TaxID=34613 RepID=A0A0K8RAZ5_IXORI
MNKGTFILLVTTQLLYHAASEYQKWTEVEHTFGVRSCWKILKYDLDAECKKKGANAVETVDFTACKMECKIETEKNLVDIGMPNDTPCGINNNETCQNGRCEGQCNIPEETLRSKRHINNVFKSQHKKNNNNDPVVYALTIQRLNAI